MKRPWPLRRAPRRLAPLFLCLWALVAALGLGGAALAQIGAPSATPTPAPAPPGPRALPSIPPDGKVTVVRIEGTIDLGLAPFLERLLAEQTDSDLLVLDINTLGGRVDAALIIRDALLHTRARTLCWVNPRAISAGALISLACDVIAVAPGATIGAATPVQMGDGEMKPVAEKVVSYMRKEMRATAEAKGRSGDIAEAMVDADLEVPGLDEKGKLLTLDGTQALAWGVAEVQAGDEAALWRALGRAAPDEVARPRLTWAEHLARFLSEPALSGLLMTLGMLGILLELYSPGHGVALVVGLSCLALFFFGHHVARLAGWEEIALFALGAGLIAVEVFVPGHFLPGVAGGLCVLAALLMAVVNLDHIPFDVAWDAGWLPRGMATVFGSVTATAVLASGAAQVLPRTRFGRTLILDAVVRGPAVGDAAVERAASLAGRVGTAATDLRPSGKVLLDGQRLEASAERGYIDAGAAVRVIRGDAGRLVVRAIEAPGQAAPRPTPAAGEG